MEKLKEVMKKNESKLNEGRTTVNIGASARLSYTYDPHNDSVDYVIEGLAHSNPDDVIRAAKKFVNDVE